MPLVDRREIEFGPEIVRLALGASPRAAAALDLPAVAPTRVRFAPAEERVDLVFGGAGVERSAPVPAMALASLLFAFCLRARMPLPRGARKTVRVTPSALVLCFELRVAPDLAALRPESAPPGAAAGSGLRRLDWSDPPRGRG